MPRVLSYEGSPGRTPVCLRWGPPWERGGLGKVLPHAAAMHLLLPLHGLGATPQAGVRWGPVGAAQHSQAQQESSGGRSSFRPAARPPARPLSFPVGLSQCTDLPSPAQGGWGCLCAPVGPAAPREPLPGSTERAPGSRPRQTGGGGVGRHKGVSERMTQPVGRRSPSWRKRPSLGSQAARFCLCVCLSLSPAPPFLSPLQPHHNPEAQGHLVCLVAPKSFREAVG